MHGGGMGHHGGHMGGHTDSGQAGSMGHGITLGHILGLNGHGGALGSHGHTGNSGHHTGGEPDTSASWNQAMQADTLASKILSANIAPLLILLFMFSGAAIWIGLVSWLHKNDSKPFHATETPDTAVLGPVETATHGSAIQQGTYSAATATTYQPTTIPFSSIPAAFGSPASNNISSSFGRPQTYAQPNTLLYTNNQVTPIDSTPTTRKPVRITVNR